MNRKRNAQDVMELKLIRILRQESVYHLNVRVFYVVEEKNKYG
jgi:hypothetical protein